MAYATVEELAAALRLTLAAANTDALQACIDAAAVEIDHYLDAWEDTPTDPDDVLANRVNILRAVEHFKAQDAAFGVLGFDETGSLRVPRDSFARHGRTLIPLKQKWGVA